MGYRPCGVYIILSPRSRWCRPGSSGGKWSSTDYLFISSKVFGLYLISVANVIGYTIFLQWAFNCSSLCGSHAGASCIYAVGLYSTLLMLNFICLILSHSFRGIVVLMCVLFVFLCWVKGSIYHDEMHPVYYCWILYHAVCKSNRGRGVASPFPWDSENRPLGIQSDMEVYYLMLVLVICVLHDGQSRRSKIGRAWMLFETTILLLNAWVTLFI